MRVLPIRAGPGDGGGVSTVDRSGQIAKRQRWIQRGLIAFGIGLLVYTISLFPLAQVADACRGLGGWVLVTPLLCMCWFLASSIALHHLLERRVPVRALMWNRVVGEGYNSLIPAGGFGGEPFKLLHITRYVDKRRGVIALLNDRMLDNAIAFGFSAACVGVGAFWLDVEPVALRTSMVIYAAVSGAVSLVIFVMTFTSITDRLGGRVARWIGATELEGKRLPRWCLLRALGWFLVARAFGVLEVALLFALLDIPVHVTTVVFTTGAVAAAGFLGFFIPQGLGVTDGATVGIFSLLHFTGPAGIAFTLARRGRMLIVSVFGVALHLVFGRTVARHAAVEGAALAAPRQHRFHRSVRAVCTHYPLPFGDDWMNRRLDRFFRGEPNWIHAPGRGAWPTMVLDVSHTLQRKFYYFPKLHGRYYGRLPFRRYLAHKLKPGATFVDIGSNVGFFSLMAARLVGPTGRVYAFEPDPHIHEALARSASANAFLHLETFQFALSDRVEECTFHCAKDGTANSLVPEAPGREGRYARTLTTQVTTLDRLVVDGLIQPRGIALLKVDVEGEEARTIAGMRDTLEAAGHPAIWCEVRGPQGSTRAPNTFAAVRDALAPLGYQPYWWNDGDRRPVVDRDVVRRTDVLFERA